MALSVWRRWKQRCYCWGGNWWRSNTRWSGSGWGSGIHWWWHHHDWRWWPPVSTSEASLVRSSLVESGSAVDANNANKVEAYNKLSRLAKCLAPWNNTARPTTAAEVVEEHCKLQQDRTPFIWPWSRVLKEQGEGAVGAICAALDVRSKYLFGCFITYTNI